jgi:hypothetical protein
MEVPFDIFVKTNSMGLDIFITFDNDWQIRNADYYANHKEYANKHNVSRTFCDFMSRQNVVNGIPELDQLGTITGVDIAPILRPGEVLG